MKVYNYREVEKCLLKNGYEFVSQKGSHRKFKKGSSVIVIKVNSVNRMLWQRLVKEHNLNVEF